MDCVRGKKDLSLLIANFKFLNCCHGNRSRKDQTAKMVVSILFWTIFLEKKCSHQIVSAFW